MSVDHYNTPNTALAPRTLSVDQMIQVWLQQKANRTRSTETERAYTSRMEEFRAALRATGLDLDSEPQLVALAAQGWADHTVRVDANGTPIAVAPATFNQRLAILSSFYQTAIKRGFLTANPIATIDRRPAEDYAEVRALDRAELRSRLEQIDRTTLKGLRDYALVAVLLTTGRRRAEVHAMRWASLHITGTGEITVSFPRTKGGKVMRDTLTPGVGQALMQWLHAFYGAELGGLPQDAPIWVSLSTNNHGQRLKSYGKPLSARSFNTICDARLGVSKVHSLRHTFADAMEEAGAKLTEIRDRLGHSNSATTDRYLQKLRRAKNRHADTIAQMFGLDEG
jgi:integrase/recombinase XerC